MSTEPLNIRPEDLTGGNPRAASVRLEGKSLSRAYGQRRHDWRIGHQPKYVDPARKGLNRPLIEPRPVSQIRNEVLALRTARGAKRAMKSNAAVVTAGIITFGIEAQEMFLALTREQQDEAFRDLARAVAERLDTSLEALTVHCDESAIHAHFELRACNRSGIPLAKATRPTLMIELQDLVFEVMSRHCPGIERGNRKYDRLAAGEDYAATVHKSVRQLHHDLPLEVARLEQDREALQASLPELTARVEEMRDRVAKLEAEAKDRVLTAAKVKGFFTFCGCGSIAIGSRTVSGISKPARASWRPSKRSVTGFKGRSKLWRIGPMLPDGREPKRRKARAEPQSGLRAPIIVFWLLRGAKRA